MLSLGTRLRGSGVRSAASARWQRLVIIHVRRRGRPVIFWSVSLGRLPGNIGMRRDAGQFVRNVLWREHEIDAACGHRAARHRIVFGRLILRERNAALGLDGLQSQRAVRRGAGQNHPDGPLALVLRQGFKKHIDGALGAAWLRARQKFQPALRNAQIRVGRNDIDMIGLDPQIVRHFAHRHRRRARQKLRERAVMLRIEMLHQHEAQTRIEREVFQQPRERLQSAGGRADADDGNGSCLLVLRAGYGSFLVFFCLHWLNHEC